MNRTTANDSCLDRAMGESAVKSVRSADFVRNFGNFCDDARLEPVVLTRNGRARLVVTSIDDYRRVISLALQAAGEGKEAERLEERLARIA